MVAELKLPIPVLALPGLSDALEEAYGKGLRMVGNGETLLVFQPDRGNFP